MQSSYSNRVVEEMMLIFVHVRQNQSASLQNMRERLFFRT